MITMNKQRTEGAILALLFLLSNASGGGSWRRVAVMKIAELRERLPEKSELKHDSTR